MAYIIYSCKLELDYYNKRFHNHTPAFRILVKVYDHWLHTNRSGVDAIPCVFKLSEVNKIYNADNKIQPTCHSYNPNN